jgi:transposase
MERATEVVTPASPTYENLRDENRQLRDENQRLREENRQLGLRVETLEAQVRKLTALLEQAQRTGKRQAAPFSKGTPKPDPKTPGRKPGKDYGPKAHRPLPEQKPDEIFDVLLPRECPDCGGLAEEDHVEQQFQVEIPRQPIVRRFDIHVGRCRRCGRRLRPRHPLQTSEATGAAASQLGPDLQTVIALMKDRYGLSYGDIQGLLEEAFGISVSRGGAAQVVRRVAERHEPAYQAIAPIVRRSDVVYPDETGWRIGGWPQWLWVFVTPTAVFCVIRPSRGHDVPEAVLGADYNGRMGHDGWAPYDFFRKATHQQCLEHLLRRAHGLLERATRGAVHFPRKVAEFLGDALGLRDRRNEGAISPHGLAVARGRLEKRLDRLLGGNLSHPGNRKFQKHLVGHRDQILTFLYEPDLEATNWPAEQALRPLVVNRKVFGGNRTAAGGHAQEILGSVFATFAKRALDTVSVVSTIICLPAEQRLGLIQQFLPVPSS